MKFIERRIEYDSRPCEPIEQRSIISKAFCVLSRYVNKSLSTCIIHDTNAPMDFLFPTPHLFVDASSPFSSDSPWKRYTGKISLSRTLQEMRASSKSRRYKVIKGLWYDSFRARSLGTFKLKNTSIRESFPCTVAADFENEVPRKSLPQSDSSSRSKLPK